MGTQVYIGDGVEGVHRLMLAVYCCEGNTYTLVN